MPSPISKKLLNGNNGKGTIQQVLSAIQEQRLKTSNLMNSNAISLQQIQNGGSQEDEFFELGSPLSVESDGAQFEDAQEYEDDQDTYDSSSDEELDKKNGGCVKRSTKLKKQGGADNNSIYFVEIELGNEDPWVDLMKAVAKQSPQCCSAALKQIIRSLQLGLLDSDSLGSNESDCFSVALENLFVLKRVLDVEAGFHWVQYSNKKFRSVGRHRLMVGEVIALLLGVGTGIGDVGAKSHISIAIAREDILTKLASIAFDHPHASTLHCCLTRCLEIAARGRCQAIWSSLLGVSTLNSVNNIQNGILQTVRKYGLEGQNQRPSVLSMSIKIACLMRQLQRYTWSHSTMILCSLQNYGAWMEFIAVDGPLDNLIQDQQGETGNSLRLTPSKCQPPPVTTNPQNNARNLTQGQLLTQREILNMVQSHVFNRYKPITN